MIEQKLGTDLVTDWREVLPIVRPFYERFFGKSIPEDLDGFILSPEEVIKITNSFNVILHIFADSIKGFYVPEINKLVIKPAIFNEFAEILIHELTHLYYEKSMANSSGIKQKISDFLSPKRAGLRRKFLDESVAHTSQYVFNIQMLNKNPNGKIEEPMAIIDGVQIELSKYLISKEAYWNAYKSARSVAKYLAMKHQNDPDLWSKLKQLQTLDDLRRLVND